MVDTIRYYGRYLNGDYFSSPLAIIKEYTNELKCKLNIGKVININEKQCIFGIKGEKLELPCCNISRICILMQIIIWWCYQ